MVGTGANNANVDAIFLVPAGEAIDDVDSVSGVEVVDGSFSIDFPYLDTESQSVAVCFRSVPKKQRTRDILPLRT